MHWEASKGKGISDCDLKEEEEEKRWQAWSSEIGGETDIEGPI